MPISKDLATKRIYYCGTIFWAIFMSESRFPCLPDAQDSCICNLVEPSNISRMNVESRLERQTKTNESYTNRFNARGTKSFESFGFLAMEISRLWASSIGLLAEIILSCLRFCLLPGLFRPFNLLFKATDFPASIATNKSIHVIQKAHSVLVWYRILDFKYANRS